MTSPRRYADPCAYREYMQNYGAEVEVTGLMNTSASEAFDAWLEHAWLSCNKQVDEGCTSRRYVGHVRLLGVQESIVSVGLPPSEVSEVEGPVILSICYKVTNVGPFPVGHSSHIASMRFLPEPGHPVKTCMLWGVKTTMTPVGNVLLCGG